jgi:hypothetical protein
MISVKPENTLRRGFLLEISKRSTHLFDDFAPEADSVSFASSGGFHQRTLRLLQLRQLARSTLTGGIMFRRQA